MIVNEVDMDEYLAHYGVPGMKWGKHKVHAYNHTKDASGVTRSKARAAVKKGNLKQRREMEDFHALTPHERDKQIIAARKALPQAQRDWADAKSKARARKLTAGKHKTRVVLNKIGNQAATVQGKANALTTAEQHRKDMIDMGNAIMQGIYGPQNAPRIGVR